MFLCAIALPKGLARCVGSVTNKNGEISWGYVADLGVECDDIFLDENAYLGISVRKHNVDPFA